MTDSPSDRAIAQAFWEIDSDCWTDSRQFEDRIMERAAAIDAAAPEGAYDEDEAPDPSALQIEYARGYASGVKDGETRFGSMVPEGAQGAVGKVFFTHDKRGHAEWTFRPSAVAWKRIEHVQWAGGEFGGKRFEVFATPPQPQGAARIPKSQADCPERHKGAYSFRHGWATGYNDAMDALAMDSARDREDAARYRWLRDRALNFERESSGHGTPWCVIGMDLGDAEPLYGSSLDAVMDDCMSIDAARADGGGRDG